MSDPDQNLVARCIAGEEDGFAELFRRHQARSLRTALALVGDVATAEEAIQEAFFRAFRTVHRKQAHVSFATWLFRYVVWSSRRQASKSRRHSTDPLGSETSTTADLDRSELRLLFLRSPDGSRTDMVIWKTANGIVVHLSPAYSADYHPNGLDRQTVLEVISHLQ